VVETLPINTRICGARITVITIERPVNTVTFIAGVNGASIMVVAEPVPVMASPLHTLVSRTRITVVTTWRRTPAVHRITSRRGRIGWKVSRGGCGGILTTTTDWVMNAPPLVTVIDRASVVVVTIDRGLDACTVSNA